MFRDSKVGDDVWSNIKGWGKITAFSKDWTGLEFAHIEYYYDTEWKDKFKIKNGEIEGFSSKNEKIYHNNLKLPKEEYTFPEKPNIPVDTKLLVSKTWIDTKPQKRHFSHFDNHTGVYCFRNGGTSFTQDGCYEHYNNWAEVYSNLIYI